MFIAHLALIFSFQFIITALLFFFKQQSKTGNRLLGVAMCILAFQHFMHYMWASQRVYQYPWLLNIDLPLDTCIAPLLFFYIKVMTRLSQLISNVFIVITHKLFLFTSTKYFLKIIALNGSPHYRILLNHWY